MSTPAQHKAAVEDLVARSYPPFSPPSAGDLLIAEARAHLSKALGTGTHYVAADGLIDKLVSLQNPAEATRIELGQKALLRAILADR